MQIANAEVDPESFLKLERCGMRVCFNLEEAEVYLYPQHRGEIADNILEVLEVVGNMGADECGIDGDRLRLWWD